MDRVRVLRLIEYEGTRELVERTVARSITMHRVGNSVGDLTIRAYTLGGPYPEILPPRDESFDSEFPPNMAFCSDDWGKRGA